MADAFRRQLVQRKARTLGKLFYKTGQARNGATRRSPKSGRDRDFTM